MHVLTKVWEHMCTYTLVGTCAPTPWSECSLVGEHVHPIFVKASIGEMTERVAGGAGEESAGASMTVRLVWDPKHLKSSTALSAQAEARRKSMDTGATLAALAHTPPVSSTDRSLPDPAPRAAPFRYTLQG